LNQGEARGGDEMAFQMKTFCPYCKKEVKITTETPKEKVKCPECKKEFIPKAKLLGEG